VFTCKFHGWSYNTEGRLVGVPDEENFFALDKAEHGLTLVATDVWEGFIFVNLDPHPQETLQEYLGEVGTDLKGYPFNELTICYTYKADERVNWKVLLDAQQEGYHVPFLHKRTFVKAVESEVRTLNFRSVAVKLYKRHRMLSAGGNPGYRPTPVEALAQRFGATTFGAMAGVTGASQERLPLVGSFDFYAIFPNFVIALMYGTYFTYNLWPLAVDRTLWEVRMYYPPAKNAGERFSQEYSKCTLRDPLLEDGSTHENTQSILASGAKTHFILQDEEITIRHSHKVVEDHVGFYTKRA
jgi:phenylpropionate dioxygenase-like ring-hydroxylating dioxygenase large terminal subunit